MDITLDNDEKKMKPILIYLGYGTPAVERNLRSLDNHTQPRQPQIGRYANMGRMQHAPTWQTIFHQTSL
ncbi:hypothetical protein R83H12_00768 [Fibrobacteria bacterium R8-3-H12]